MSKEYIEKEAAIQSIKDESCCFNDDYDYELAIEAIEDTPSAKVKPVVMGEWVKVEEDLYWCSHCHSEIEVRNIYINAFNFCPCCGAEMRKEYSNNE